MALELIFEVINKGRFQKVRPGFGIKGCWKTAVLYKENVHNPLKRKTHWCMNVCRHGLTV